MESKAAVPLNPSYTIRVLSCVFFICLTEILLAHYVYRLIYSEMKSDFISRQEFQQVFINELRNNEAIIRKMHQVIPERRKRAVDTILPQTAEPYVEFISPENNTARGTTENDSWFYLSSYSRIPKKTLDGYCKKMSTLCPPPPTRAGPIGPPGVPGLKGDRGDTGLPGVPGAQGPRGLSGVPGVTGMKGEQGRPGLDGRDGIPGEPGLDGMPGRNGHDGKDGTDGPPGIPGRDAKDGKDGMPGLLGPQGPPGPQGSRGLTGPRGRPGKHGNHGTPGAPGITTWTTKTKLPLNVSQLLIPPSIAEYSPRTSSIMVEEGDHARILCSATGSPKPKITWQRLDNRPINRGAWQDVGITGETLNITRVNRIHMGVYVCIADNGIPPQANKTFNLEVLFPPLIRIKNQMVGATNGSTATLECETEAYPEPIRYWKRSDGLLIENGTKYQIFNIVDRDIFRTRMQLNIFRINHHDLDKFYYCVSKNELQTTTGEITLFEGTPMFGGNNENRATIYGMLPPDKVSLEDLCGPPVECPECATKCNASGVSLNDIIDGKWDVRPYGLQKYQKYPPRITNCVLYAVGKPVYHRYTDDVYGSWMRDPQPPRPDDEDKYFVTKKKDKNILYEYANKTMFRKDKAIQHDLGKAPFQGNSHLVYKNYFYYNEENTTRIVKFGLGNGKISTLELPVDYNKTVPLYNNHYNLVDFSLDDNGLWVIFAVPDSNKTAVMKIDDEKFQIQYIWNISVNHHKVGEMFIVCGVLYAIDSITDKNTIIRFAFDLYTGKLLDVADLSLSFTNPFGKTTMITYNDRSKELYTWDKGNQLTYPVRYRELGFNSTVPPTPD